MTPTTRNSLMVGGALIVIALLLTCSPIRGMFGAGDAGTSADVATSDATPLPPVGAAPPVNTGAALGAATTGAVAGSQIGSADAAAVAGAASNSAAPVLVAGAAGAAGAAGSSAAGSATATAAGAAGVSAGVVAATAAGAGAGAAGAGASGAGASVAAASTGIVLPSVSAGPPSVAVSNSIIAAAVNPAIALAASAAAASAFDNAFDSAFAGGTADMPAAGVVVGRFAPPVATISSQRLTLNGVDRAVGIGAAGIRAPCDSPGAGCRNVQVSMAPPIPVNPPIVSGPTPP